MLLAKEEGCASIAFPLLATGSYGYPKEKGIRIALDEIAAFLMEYDMQVYLVLFDQEAVDLIQRVYPIEESVDLEYVANKRLEEYGGEFLNYEESFNLEADTYDRVREILDQKLQMIEEAPVKRRKKEEMDASYGLEDLDVYYDRYGDRAENELSRKLKGDKDALKSCLIHILNAKSMSRQDLINKSGVPKQIISNIWNIPTYRPDKSTIYKMCIGARLNLDETKLLLEKAGFVLSPFDKRDVVIAHYIEYQVYDASKIDSVLEENNLPRLFRD